MTLDDYQKAAMRTAVYPDRGKNLAYAVDALAAEAGEVVGKMAKWRRGDLPTTILRSQLATEAGDVLWQLACLAHELGMSLEGIAAENLAKLAHRAERGVLQGNGDDR